MLPILLVSLFAADPEPITPPKGEGPQIALVQAVGGNLTLTVARAVPVSVQEKRVREVDGKKVEEIVALTKYTMVQEKVAISTAKAKFSTANGKKLDAEAALKALATPQYVALAQDGKPVDPAYLRVLKPDTLVIVAERAEPETLPPAIIRPFIRPRPRPEPPVIRD